MNTTLTAEAQAFRDAEHRIEAADPHGTHAVVAERRMNATFVVRTTTRHADGEWRTWAKFAEDSTEWFTTGYGGIALGSDFSAWFADATSSSTAAAVCRLASRVLPADERSGAILEGLAHGVAVALKALRADNSGGYTDQRAYAIEALQRLLGAILGNRPADALVLAFHADERLRLIGRDLIADAVCGGVTLFLRHGHSAKRGTRKSDAKQAFTVVGIYAGTRQRFAGTVEAKDAGEAETLAVAAHPSLRVAGVFAGSLDALDVERTRT